MIGHRCVRVLIVEDKKADARLVQALLEETGVPATITFVEDGEKAIEFMEDAANGDNPAPDLVLLDINLPKLNGHEVLTRIREHARIAHTFIAMCSGSSSCEDIRRSRSNGADAYFLKPTGMEEMDEIVNRLREILTSIDGTERLISLQH